MPAINSNPTPNSNSNSVPSTLPSPLHLPARRALRILGPALIGIGVLGLLAAIIDFTLSIGSFRTPYFFIFGGLLALLIPLGLFLTSVGFMGAIARYQAAEAAPVAKDTFNYLAKETQPGVKTVAQSIGEGLAAAGRTKQCSTCAQMNDPDARFCDNCGIGLT